jgi:RNA polymerase sigma-70 factor, ECF subfamily
MPERPVLRLFFFQSVATETDPDADLMLQLKDGDDLALNKLMARWQKPLVAFIHRYLGNEAEALDLAQETFVRVYQSRDRYKASAKFSTWLFTIASNLCRNSLRWRSRHPTLAATSVDAAGDLHDLFDETASPECSPSDYAAQNDLADAVREQVQALPHDLKTAVLLFEYEERSHQEIASVLGCTAKAVETRLYRARKLLRDGLAQWNSLSREP